MSITLSSWQRLWGELGVSPANGGLFNQLVAAYSEPQRHYHTLQHLRECMALFDAAAPLARRPAEVELALWFHDAVYDPRAQDNEERSAEWTRGAVRAAGCDPELAERVAALVLSTRHDAAPVTDGPDVELLLDVDLAILGSAPGRFEESSRQIRVEYAHVPEAEYRTGRSRILRGFLARERIYRTDVFHDSLEAKARANLEGALRELERP